MNNSDYRLIRISELKVFANHGVYEQETEAGQNFYINAELVLEDDEQDVLSDELDSTVNYAEVCEFITEYMKENTCKLIERIAELLCMELLRRYNLVTDVTVEIRKPEAPIGLPVESVSVERHMSWHTAYLSMGSNVGDKQAYLDGAIEALSNDRHTQVITESDRIVTKPYGPVEQDDFINGAVMIRTMLSPRMLLDFLHEIEAAADRTREIHWGPRTLDLDIIFYDDIMMSQEILTIPHPDMHNRYFVLKPLSELAGFYRHPVFGQTVNELLAEIDSEA